MVDLSMIQPNLPHLVEEHLTLGSSYNRVPHNAIEPGWDGNHLLWTQKDLKIKGVRT